MESNWCFSKTYSEIESIYEIIQARKKLFCHMIVKDYLCNALRKFLVKFESTWRREIKQETP